MRSRRLYVATAAVIGSFATPAPAVAFEPIEGVWRSEGSSGSVTLVQQKAPGVFRSVIIQGHRDCVGDDRGFVNQVGREIEMRGGGLDYQAAVVWVAEDCTPGGTGLSVYRVISAEPGNYRLRVCAAEPGTGAPQIDAAYNATSPTTRCTTSIRVHEPRPPVTLSSFVAVPRAPRCTRQTRRRGRSIQIRLSNQTNEPVFEIKVRIGRRVVYRYDYPGTLAPSVRVRVPKRPSQLSIAIKTTSNKSFTRTQQFSRCGRG